MPSTLLVEPITAIGNTGPTFQWGFNQSFSSTGNDETGKPFTVLMNKGNRRNEDRKLK
jgi:hypothetical protein